MKTFRLHHLFQALEIFDEQTLPLDLFLSRYFRTHKAIGAKDRALIADTIYEMIRWKGLLDYLVKEPATWQNRYEMYQQKPIASHLEDESIPPNIRVSFPEYLFGFLVENYGMDKAVELCLASNTKAPTTVRVNTLKTTRDKLLESWKEQYEVIPCSLSPNGIQFLKKINFFGLQEFKDGLFEVQDEASQLLADLVNPIPGDLVLDYCSGSGGKTLAFAPKLQGKGQVFLHDIRPHILFEAKKRLKRAGIENAQIAMPDDPKLKKLSKKMNWVLVDAPCTGTGTFRRNPDMKWKTFEDSVERLVGQQRSIFEKALSFLAPEGKIVYATCSLLKQENELQVEHFIKTYNLVLEGPLFQTWPKENAWDGFFGAVLKKREIK